MLAPEIYRIIFDNFRSTKTVIFENRKLRYWWSVRKPIAINVYDDTHVEYAKNLRLVCQNASFAFTPWDIYKRIGGDWMRSVNKGLMQENALIAKQYLFAEEFKKRALELIHFNISFVYPWGFKKTIYPFATYVHVFMDRPETVFDNDILSDILDNTVLFVITDLGVMFWNPSKTKNMTDEQYIRIPEIVHLEFAERSAMDYRARRASVYETPESEKAGLVDKWDLYYDSIIPHDSKDYSSQEFMWQLTRGVRQKSITFNKHQKTLKKLKKLKKQQKAKYQRIESKISLNIAKRQNIQTPKHMKLNKAKKWHR